VDSCLVAVISLPAGCFNPYSGVKTSILLLDKGLAKQARTVAFFKVENDGFGLGAQRRAIEKNDLPQVQTELAAYLHAIRTGASSETLTLSTGLIVPKAKIAGNGEYNLSGERYREGIVAASSYPTVRLEEVAKVTSGNSAPQGDEYFAGGNAAFIRTSDVGAVHLSDNFVGSADKVNAKALAELRLELFPSGTILFPKSGASTFLNHRVVMGAPAYVSSHLACIICDELKALPKFVYYLLCRVDARDITPDQAYPSLRLTEIGAIQIPLPPLEVQHEIVAEIEGYQKVINGARAVLDHYRPHIPIHPDWPMVELSEIIDELESGVSVNSTSIQTNNGELGILKTSCVTMGIFQPEEHKTVVPEELKRVRCPVRGNTIIISRMNTEALVGANAYVDKDYPNLFLPDRLWQTVITRTDVEVRYIQTVLASDSCRSRISAVCGGTSGSMKNIAKPQLLSITVPLPPLATQQAIVAELEAEQSLVAANRELITRFERKIQATLARVWGKEIAVALEC
jgi:type I restriction enzyme M protein